MSWIVARLDGLDRTIAARAHGSPAWLVAGAFGLVAMVHFPFGPGFSLFAVVAALLLPVSVRALHSRWGFWLTATAVLWLVGQVVSNAVHQDGLRALAFQLWYPLILIAVIPFGFLVVSWGTDVAFRALTGLLLGHLAFGAVRMVGAPPGEAWKFELALPVLLLVMLGADHLADTWRRRALFALAAGTLSAVSLAADARLWAGAAFAAALAILVLQPQFDVRRRLVALCCMFTLLIVAYVGFVQLAKQGSLGEDFEYRVTRQGGVSPRAVLAARPEAVFSASLIASSPVIGLGGRPELSDKQVADGEELLRTVSGREDRHVISWVTLRGYNAHSLTLSFWVYAGLAAGAFWICWLGFLGAGFAQNLVSSRPVSYIVLLAVPIAVWDAFFSPWAPHYEVIMATVLLALLANSWERRA